MHLEYNQSQMFNPQYVNQDYLQQLQMELHHQEQTQEIQKAVKAIEDYCKAVKRITPDYQQQAFAACAAVVLRELSF